MKKNSNSFKWRSLLYTKAWSANLRRKKILSWSKRKLKTWESTIIQWTLGLLSSSSRWSNSVLITMVGSRFRLSRSSMTIKRRMRRKSFMLLWWEVQQMLGLMIWNLNTMSKRSYLTTFLRPHSLICPRLMGKEPFNWLLQKVCSRWSKWRTYKIVRWQKRNHQKIKIIMRSPRTKAHQRLKT